MKAEKYRRLHRLTETAAEESRSFVGYAAEMRCLCAITLTALVSSLFGVARASVTPGAVHVSRSKVVSRPQRSAGSRVHPDATAAAL